MDKEIILNHVSVVFAETTDQGFGKSLTIDCTEPDLEASIRKWAEANKYDNLKIKDYTDKEGKTTKQATFKFSKFINIAGKDGATEKDLSRGAVVNMIVKAYEYNNISSGISASISNIFIVEKGKSKMVSISE